MGTSSRKRGSTTGRHVRGGRWAARCVRTARMRFLSVPTGFDGLKSAVRGKKESWRRLFNQRADADGRPAKLSRTTIFRDGAEGQVDADPLVTEASHRNPGC